MIQAKIVRIKSYGVGYMRYCSGSGFELLSDSDVMAICAKTLKFSLFAN